MTNLDKLRKAIVDAATEKYSTLAESRLVRESGNHFKADMMVMDADFIDEQRRSFAKKLLDITNRQAEIEAFEKRRDVQIDVMLYDIPMTGSLDDWWDFIHDDTAVIKDGRFQVWKN